VRRRPYLLSATLAASLFSLAAAGMEGCVLPSFEYDPLKPDAGDDAPSDAPEAGPPGCGKTYPDPPGGADQPINNTFVLAFRSIDLGEGAASPPGYDLDHQCTCINGVGPSCVSLQNHCDAPDGVDNASAQLISLVQLGLGAGIFGSSYFSTKANEGNWSLLLQVSNYNGLADDPSVDVAMYPSPGMVGMMPTWNGTDAWPISATCVMGGDPQKPLFASKGAYVTSHVLVAAMPSVALTISGGVETITFHLTGGVVTGTLSGPPGHLQITDGVMAARWQAQDIFNALSSYRGPDSKPICTDIGFTYQTAKTAICNGLDILADASGAKSLPCDSLSMGLGFRAEEALLGAVTAPPQPSAGCSPATDPANDHCAP